MATQMFYRIMPWFFLTLLVLLPLRAEPQVVSQIHDPLRGVTFYSMQISTEPLTTLQPKGGLFAETDLMTLGLSAILFDESSAVREYVLWLRHNGPRRWFISTIERPLTLSIDGQSRQPVSLHTTRPDNVATGGQFVEILEFAISEPEFESILEADVVSIQLQTALSKVEKSLNESELSAIRRYSTMLPGNTL